MFRFTPVPLKWSCCATGIRMPAPRFFLQRPRGNRLRPACKDALQHPSEHFEFGFRIDAVVTSNR